MNDRRGKGRFLILLFVLSLGPVGCVNLGAIAAFGSADKKAQERFPLLVADLEASCKRRVDYQELAKEKVDRHSFSKDEQKACGPYAKDQGALVAAGDTLFTYLDTLSAVAANQKSSLPMSASEIVDYSPNLTVNQKKAFTGLSRFVSDALTQGIRQSNLATIIKTRNSDVKMAVEALTSILVRDYALLLENENQEMRNYYLTKISEDRNRHPLLVILVERQWKEDRDALAKRLASSKAFGQMLEAIAKVHNQLAIHASEISSKTLLQSTLNGAAQIATLAGEFVAAFPSGR